LATFKAVVPRKKRMCLLLWTAAAQAITKNWKRGTCATTDHHKEQQREQRFPGLSCYQQWQINTHCSTGGIKSVRVKRASNTVWKLSHLAEKKLNYFRIKYFFTANLRRARLEYW
jgi:hypothetical protein